MIILENNDELKEHVKKITAAKREKSLHEVTQMSPLEATIREQMEYVDSDLKPVFAALIFAIEGKTVDLNEEDDGNKYDYPKFSAVVPLVNVQEHDYPLNKAFIVTRKDSDGQAMYGIKCDPDDRCGNTHFGVWRYATDEEIDGLFSTFGADEDILSRFS